MAAEAFDSSSLDRDEILVLLEVAVTAMARARVRRDRLITLAKDRGIPDKDVMGAARLSRPRLDQIRKQAAHA